jgi:hypothetical protein
MSSFIRFVLKYKKSDCRFGDVARDMLEDPRINRRWGYRSTKAYLDTVACTRVMDIVEELHEEYKRRLAMLYH